MTRQLPNPDGFLTRWIERMKGDDMSIKQQIAVTDAMVDAAHEVVKRYGGYSKGQMKLIIEAALAASLQGGEADPYAYCEPANPLNRDAFAWPGSGKEDRHSMALYTTPPPAELERDAARYRWLRDAHGRSDSEWHIRDEFSSIIGQQPEELDAAIDAAMGDSNRG